jgi:excinuclease ABC subunit A
VKKLLDILNSLVDLGNTVIVIEHNLDVVKMADWIIDLGPEGGEHGGRIVGEGSPESVARLRSSATGEALRRVLRPARKGESPKSRTQQSIRSAGR